MLVNPETNEDDLRGKLGYRTIQKHIVCDKCGGAWERDKDRSGAVSGEPGDHEAQPEVIVIK